jgi:hypothetical protein
MNEIISYQNNLIFEFNFWDDIYSIFYNIFNSSNDDECNDDKINIESKKNFKKIQNIENKTESNNIQNIQIIVENLDEQKKIENNTELSEPIKLENNNETIPIIENIDEKKENIENETKMENKKRKQKKRKSRKFSCEEIIQEEVKDENNNIIKNELKTNHLIEIDMNEFKTHRNSVFLKVNEVFDDNELNDEIILENMIMNKVEQILLDNNNIDKKNDKLIRKHRPSLFFKVEEIIDEDHGDTEIVNESKNNSENEERNYENMIMNKVENNLIENNKIEFKNDKLLTKHRPSLFFKVEEIIDDQMNDDGNIDQMNDNINNDQNIENNENEKNEDKNNLSMEDEERNYENLIMNKVEKNLYEDTNIEYKNDRLLIKHRPSLFFKVEEVFDED